MIANLRDNLRAAVRPLVEKMVDQVVDLVATQTEASYELAARAVIEQLRAQRETPVAVPTRKPATPRKRRVQRKARPAVRSTKRRRRRAKKLPEKGHNTSGIPARADASESKSAVDAPVPEAVSKRGAPRQSGNGDFSPPARPDRFAQIEAQAKARQEARG